MRKVAASIAIGILLLVACADDDTGPEDPSGSQSHEITVQVSGEREETAVYRAMVRAYENDHPETTVNLVEIAEKDDHLAKLSTSFAGGDPPDVFLVNFREYSQFVALGAVEPFEAFLEQNEMDLADYFPAPVEAFTFGGELQCMPQNVSSLVVYYNVDLFEQAGIDPPSEGWTWDDLRAAGERLTDDRVRGIGIEPSIIRIAPFVWSAGGDIVDDLETPTTFTLDTPEAREALTFIADLVRDGLVPSEEEVGAQDLETRFVTQKLAMLLSSRRDTPSFREVSDLNFDVGPLPVADEPVGILHSDGYCIAAGSDQAEEAARFIAYATGQQGQTLTALGGRTVPSLMSVAESGAFLDPSQEPEHSQVFLDAVPNLRRTPVIPTWPEIEDLAEEFLTRFFYDEGYTVDDLVDALEDAEPLFSEGVDQLP